MSKKTKILHIITRLDKGGSADNTLLSVLGLNKNIFQVDLVSGRTRYPSAKLKKLKKQNTISYIEIPQLVRAINPLKDIMALCKLYRIIKNVRYDIVHTHSSKAGLLGRIAARIAGIKHIIHTPHGHIFYGYYGKIISYLFILFERWAATFSERIITLTDAGKQEHIRYHIAPEGKFVTIHSGIELDYLYSYQGKKSIREEFGIDENDKLVGTIARLVPIKGHEFLIKAAPLVTQHHPKTTFLIVGDGPLREKLQKLSEKLRIADRIIFCGMRDDIPSLLKGMDLFVLPSLNEGMGRVLVEAMAFGKLIVAAKVGGIPEVIEDGITGLLVPPAKPDALAEAICHIISNPEMAAKLAKNASQQAKKFRHTEMIQQLENLYNGLMYQ